MEWTREQKCRKLEDATIDELTLLEKQVAQCPWRQTFHIQPKTGLLNDPNGLAFYQGEYHIFYQWFPLGPVHGLKYWYHLKSTDLINWQDLGIGITPDQYYENYGAYSGSGFEHDGDLYLMYTGNHRDENMVRHPMQAIAIMKPDGQIEKLLEPVIKDVPEGYTEHFRDRKFGNKTEFTMQLSGRNDKMKLDARFFTVQLTQWSGLSLVKSRQN
ncbi:sucrose-6-phosphate hydrolase [Alkalibacterium indicireducens]|uniref:beta-fructofuranosidase n=1 Tax=Alkalibacterium indicireducens TaxID=398758 RepID=A0ABN1AQS9_9LACT